VKGKCQLGDWDDLTKVLIRAYPQDLVSLVFQDARYLTTITNELKVRSIAADFMCKVERNGETFILHIEFQKNSDAHMGERTWEYNSATTIVEKMKVYSVVIYLTEKGTIDEPPYRTALKDGRSIHTFDYENILLWKVPPEVLKQKGMEGLLTLLPLTQGAEFARDEVTRDMIQGLRAAGKDDLLPLGYTVLGLVYKTQADKQAIRRIIAMFAGKLEESWYYQDVIAQGIEQGKQQGIEQGIEQGKVQTLRSMLIRVAETRFPDVLPLAQQEAERSTTPAELNAKVNKLLIAKTSEEARQALQES
jgi:predicted transposase YdaD